MNQRSIVFHLTRKELSSDRNPSRSCSRARPGGHALFIRNSLPSRDHIRFFQLSCQYSRGFHIFCHTLKNCIAWRSHNSFGLCWSDKNDDLGVTWWLSMSHSSTLTGFWADLASAGQFLKEGGTQGSLKKWRSRLVGMPAASIWSNFYPNGSNSTRVTALLKFLIQFQFCAELRSERRTENSSCTPITCVLTLQRYIGFDGAQRDENSSASAILTRFSTV
jgi:hypothetical protein